MATYSQITEYKKLREDYDEKLALIVRRLERALPTAKAQLAVVLGNGELRAEDEPVVTGRTKAPPVVPLDITQREGFDPNNPAKVLSDEERRRLPGASLVVDSMRDYIDLTLRLSNQRPPQVTRHGVTRGMEKARGATTT